MLGGFVDVLLKVSSRQIMKNKNHDDCHWGNSLKFLPWDNSFDKDNTEKMISATVHEWYDAKHRKDSLEEIEFINSIKIKQCPKCGSASIVKNGFYISGYQKYLCKNCGKKFSPLTNTIFDSKKIPISEWIEYLLHLFEFHSITTSARDNRNAYSTGKYWLIKVFEVLKDIQDNVILEGIIYIDEIFFPVIKHKTIIKDNKKLRGISRNKIAVATGVDDNGNILIIVEHTSKPSDTSTFKAYSKHIKPGSHLIHDGEKSHNILVEKLNLSQEIYKSNDTKGLSDEDNPLYKINHLHFLIKRFMKQHGGYNRDDLQDWMNLICFVLSKPYDRYDKIKKFIEIAINTPVRVKYRDVMSKISDR